MSNEMREKATPGYVGMLSESRKQTELLEKQLKLVEDQIKLQGELNVIAYELLEVERCRKENDKKHRGLGYKSTMFALVLATSAFVVEIASKGEVPLFTTVYKYLKGLVL